RRTSPGSAPTRRTRSGMRWALARFAPWAAEQGPRGPRLRMQGEVVRSGRPSATAELIALGTVYLSRDPQLGRFVPERARALSEVLLSGSAPGQLALIRIASRPGLRALVRGLERVVLPGILLHYALRKRFIEESARAFLARGDSQLVVLGAGFDTLAARIAEASPGVTCVELDHP